MQYIRLSLSLLAFTLVSACGDATSPSSEAQTGSATSSKPGPWDTLAALPPEDQPYGLDVYTAKCASCHGNLGQGGGNNPTLKGVSPTVMQQKLLDYRTRKAVGKADLSDAEIASVSMYAGD